MRSIAKSYYLFGTARSSARIRGAANKEPSVTRRITSATTTGVSLFERLLPCRHQWQSTTTTTTTTSAAEQAYERYLQARQKLQDIQQERERQQSQQLYEAWQRAEEQAAETKKKPKAAATAGVAVIKTLAKQTRKQRQGEEDEKSSDELQYWKQQMQTALEHAAVEYQHPTAWVQLGNQFLHNQQQQNENATEQTSDNDNNNNDDKENKRLHQALECYEKACQLGSAEGCYNWGHLLWTGWPPQDSDDNDNNGNDNDNSSNTSNRSRSNVVLQADHAKALEAFRKAMDLGDADAMYFYGVLFVNNDKDKDTTKDGLKWIEKAADKGHGGALYYLALFHLNGHEGMNIEPCTEGEFVRRLDAAVGAGDPEALFLRGHSHYHGNSGYSLDYAAALRDFLKAAEKGHADAAVSAGAMLHQPSHPGIQQDQRRAFELYQYAGELGSREGWRNVVACYLTGEGVSQSKGMAKYIADTMLKDDVANTIAPS